MNTQTISDLKAAAPANESLWHFISQLPMTSEAQIFYALLIGGLVGMGAHYFVKWAQGDIAGSLVRYLFLDDPRRTWFAISVLVSELMGEISLSMFTTPDGHFLGWAAVLLSGLKSGYLIDSAANKGARPIWSQAQRDARMTEPPK